MRSKGRGAAATSWIRDTRKRSLGYKAHAPYHPADRETRTAWWSKNKAYTPYDRPSSPGERWNDPGVRRTRLIPSSLPRKPRQLARDAPSAHRKRTAPQKQVVRCTHHTLAGTQQHRQPPMHFLCARSASAGKRDRRSVLQTVSWDGAAEEATRMDARARSIAPRQAYNAGTAGMHSSRIPMSFISTTTAGR